MRHIERQKTRPFTLCYLFRACNTAILGKIHHDLIEGKQAEKRVIRAEPYKLNVYGEANLLPNSDWSLTDSRQRRVLQGTQGHSARPEHVWLACHCVPYPAYGRSAYP